MKGPRKRNWGRDSMGLTKVVRKMVKMTSNLRPRWNSMAGDSRMKERDHVPNCLGMHYFGCEAGVEQ